VADDLDLRATPAERRTDWLGLELRALQVTTDEKPGSNQRQTRASAGATR
jgi:hypothetical protein